MSGKCAVSDAHIGYLGKCRLKCRKKLGLWHSVYLFPVVLILNVSADICIEQNRVDYLIRIFAVASYGNLSVEIEVEVHHSEGNGRGSAVLVAGYFLLSASTPPAAPPNALIRPMKIILSYIYL